MMQREAIVEQIRQDALPLASAADLDPLIEAIGDAELVLLGEASHGTSEFYTLRTELSKRLIREKGFNFIAVEGDWPSCYTVNQFIKDDEGAPDSPREALREFNRWPTWMWANQEVLDLVRWLRAHNDESPGQKVGFYGLDVYSLWESMEAVIRHLERTGAPELQAARNAFACFEPFSRDPQTYGVSAAFLGESCEAEVIELLQALQAKRRRSGPAGEGALSDEINAMVAVNAERYYRSMVRGGNDSWNIRDHHMVEALRRIQAFHGPGAKAIIWEHNTHIGDARATDMVDEGMVNVGQLVREQWGHERTFAVGFGTHRGTVIAASEWGGEIERMKVPVAMRDSWEELLHRAGSEDKLLLLHQHPQAYDAVLGHRAIGVVYHPQWERGNYVPTRVAERYDAFIYIDESRGVEPLVQEVLYV